ncbi:MAG: PCRF domain-containing protein, partial [Patescibacteria group bacterium]|nr:PCRF domain-containing protein [Patescibacteria group bacterium]
MNDYQNIVGEFETLNRELSSGESFNRVEKARRHAELLPIYNKITILRGKNLSLEENQKLLQDPDEQIRALAELDTTKLRSEISNLKSEIEDALLPRDPLDENDCIMEIRAGAGGDESTLFAAEL